MKKIGFIGLGIMGKPMAKNLLRAGYELTACDVRPEPLREIVEAGATAASSPAGVAASAEVIVTMLPNSPEVKEAVLGKGGVMEGARPGSIVVDMSSIAPPASQEISARLAEKGVTLLDAPVSGGEPKAIAGTLAIMVGGPEPAFEAVRDRLRNSRTAAAPSSHATRHLGLSSLFLKSGIWPRCGGLRCAARGSSGYRG